MVCTPMPAEICFTAPLHTSFNEKFQRVMAALYEKIERFSLTKGNQYQIYTMYHGVLLLVKIKNRGQQKMVFYYDRN